MLKTVHFTTINSVSVFNREGFKVDEYVEERPHTIHALPYSTAMTYAKFGNFRIEPYVIEPGQKGDFKKSAGKSKGEMRVVATGGGKGRSSAAPTTVHDAAATGDLASALNAGA